MSSPNLFARLPEERASALDQRIADLVYGEAKNKFGACLGSDERRVLRGIRFHRDSGNPVTIRTLVAMTDLDERRIKAAVRALRLDFEIPIGASKSGRDGGGYFLMLRPEDLELFIASQLLQVRAELQLVHAFGGTRAAREMLGQLQLEMTNDDVQF